MKVLILIFSLIVLTAFAEEPAWLTPSNPSPTITVEWDASTSTNVVSYNIYYGIGHGQYTNRVQITSGLTIRITLAERGLKYYLAATAVDSTGLESDFSNEITYTAPEPPGPPVMHPTFTATIESQDGLFAPWEEQADLQYSLDSTAEHKFFRLKIETNQ
jgi:fibronectin type 3 domain-containing protein